MRSDRIILAVSLLFLIGALSLWWQGAFASDRDDLLLISGKDAQNGDGKLGERLEDGAMGGPAGTSSEDRNEEVRKQIFVHVTGAVKSPGVYTLFEGQRVYEVLDLAEPLDDADVDLLNLAGVLYDQDKIYVPKKGEVLPGPDASSAGGAGGSNRPPSTININTAGAKDLENLPGIGPAKAQAIVEFRTKQGPFSKKEDIKKVSGIGDATYSKIESLITVK